MRNHYPPHHLIVPTRQRREYCSASSAPVLSLRWDSGSRVDSPFLNGRGLWWREGSKAAAAAAVVMVEYGIRLKYFFVRSQWELREWVGNNIVHMSMKGGELWSKIDQMRRDFGNQVRTMVVVLFWWFGLQDYFQFQFWIHGLMRIGDADTAMCFNSLSPLNFFRNDNIWDFGGGNATAIFYY